MDEIDQLALEDQKRQKVEDTAAKQALAEPFPGPLGDVFAMPDSIAVGRYKVRPFYDVDFEYLTALKHPFLDLMKRGMAGEAPPEEGQLPSGAQAWQLCWVMTRSPEEVDEVVAKDGMEGLRAAARAEFGKFQIRQLTAVYSAVVRQLSVYWSPYLGYEPVPLTEPGEEDAKADSPPSGLQPTASAG